MTTGPFLSRRRLRARLILVRSLHLRFRTNGSRLNGRRGKCATFAHYLATGRSRGERFSSDSKGFQCSFHGKRGVSPWRVKASKNAHKNGVIRHIHLLSRTSAKSPLRGRRAHARMMNARARQRFIIGPDWRCSPRVRFHFVFKYLTNSARSSVFASLRARHDSCLRSNGAQQRSSIRV